MHNFYKNFVETLIKKFHPISASCRMKIGIEITGRIFLENASTIETWR